MSRSKTLLTLAIAAHTTCQIDPRATQPPELYHPPPALILHSVTRPQDKYFHLATTTASLDPSGPVPVDANLYRPADPLPLLVYTLYYPPRRPLSPPCLTIPAKATTTSTSNSIPQTRLSTAAAPRHRMAMGRPNNTRES